MEEITPALSQNIDKSLKDLSPQEFQRLLSSWFEERGIVQDMKSYLKFQMINVLKSTAIGKNMTKYVSQAYSLAQQATHLIVAEYLLQNQCHFTFSLFSNEVNLTNILPQEKLFLYTDNSKETTNIFDKDNLINVLELIGISKDNEYFTQIINQYFDNQMSSLLCCLIALMGKSIKEPITYEQEYKADMECEDEFIGNICQVLQSFNLPQKTQSKLLQNIKLFYDLKTKSFENQCVSLINRFQKELSIRDKTIRDYEKQRKSLEKKLLKLQEENESLKEKVNSHFKGSETVESVEKIISVCPQKHCNAKCYIDIEPYKKEIQLLKTANNNQREEIQKLSINCNELLKEFNYCQSKINIVSTKIQEDAFEEVNSITTAYIDNNTGNISPDSDTTITEKILQQTREKLKLLEEESKELDIRFSKFVIK